MEINNFCLSISPILQSIGQVLFFIKVFLPLVLIILGIFDICKAIISSKSDDIKKNLKNFFKKIIVCITLFLVPTICMIIFNFVGDFQEATKNSGLDYDVCYDCMFKPSDDNCSDAVEIAKAD